jgi:leader peptidase (prepilin peptidase) / N-methyltransferase
MNHCLAFLVIGTCAFISAWIPRIAIFSLVKRKHLIFPPFVCSQCSHLISCSFYFPKGFCLVCKKKWNQIQVIISVITVIASVLVSLQEPTLIESLVAICFINYLILISLTDLWVGLIPNMINFLGGLCFFVLRCLSHPRPIFYYVVSFVILYLIFYFISKLTQGLGGGDAKLIAVATFVIGWHILIALWIATIIALLYVGVRFIYAPLKMGEPFPFGPHLALGCYLSYLWGDFFLRWYLYFIYW